MNVFTFRAILERIRAAQFPDAPQSVLAPVLCGVVRGLLKIPRPCWVMGALVLPLGLFFSAWRLTSWRPHRVALLDSSHFGYGRFNPNVKMSADGRTVIAVFADRNSDKASVWNVSDSRLLCAVPIAARTETGATPYALSPRGDSFVVAWGTGAANNARRPTPVGAIFSRDGRKRCSLLLPIGTSARRDDEPLDVHFSRDGKFWIASAHSLSVWSARTGRLLRRSIFPPAPDGLNVAEQACFLGDDRLSRTCRGLQTRWDVRARPQQISGPIFALSPASSPDKKRLVSFDGNGAAIFCSEATTGKTLWRTLTEGTGRFPSLLWARDGREIYVLTDHSIQVFSAQDGRTLRTIDLQIRAVQLLPAPSPDEVWCLDQNARLWSQRVR